MSADKKSKIPTKHERRVLSAEDFSDEQIEAIRNAEVPAKYAYLNEELQDNDLLTKPETVLRLERKRLKYI